MKYDIHMIPLLFLLLLSGLLAEEYDLYEEDDDYEEKEIEWKPSRDWKSKLEQDILPKAKGPPFNATQRISVQILFSTFDHFVLDEVDQLLQVQGRFCLVWNDQRLLWDPAEYDGISDLHVFSSQDIWVPMVKTSSSMRSPSHFDQTKEPIHIYVFGTVRTPLVYVISCPRFTIKTGCALDMSDFPYDRHVCSFMITVIQWQNINLYAYNSINEQQEKMRHILTRNDTRPTIGNFTVLSINSTTKWSDGYNLYNSSTASKKPLIPIALQMVEFQRAYSNYPASFAIPSFIFAVLNVGAVLMIHVKHSICLFLLNICLIGHFIRDAVPKFPLYFSKTPEIVRYITTSFCLASFGVVYLLTREIILNNFGQRTVVEQLPNRIDNGVWKDVILKKILSVDCVIILISFLTTIWYIL